MEIGGVLTLFFGGFGFVYGGYELSIGHHPVLTVFSYAFGIACIVAAIVILIQRWPALPTASQRTYPTNRIGEYWNNLKQKLNYRMEFPAWILGLGLLLLALPFVQSQLDRITSKPTQNAPQVSVGSDSRALSAKTDDFIKGLQSFSSQDDYRGKRVTVFCLAGNDLSCQIAHDYFNAIRQASNWPTAWGGPLPYDPSAPMRGLTFKRPSKTWWMSIQTLPCPVLTDYGMSSIVCTFHVMGGMRGHLYLETFQRTHLL